MRSSAFCITLIISCHAEWSVPLQLGGAILMTYPWQRKGRIFTLLAFNPKGLPPPVAKVDQDDRHRAGHGCLLQKRCSLATLAGGETCDTFRALSRLVGQKRYREAGFSRLSG